MWNSFTILAPPNKNIKAMPNLLVEMFKTKTPTETKYPRVMNAYQLEYIGAKHRSINAGANYYAEVWQLNADTFQLRIKGKVSTLLYTRNDTDFSRLVQVVRYLKPRNEGKGVLTID